MGEGRNKMKVKDSWNFEYLNPLTPNSDHHQFSPNNIHMLPRKWLWELIKWSLKRKCFDLLSNSLYWLFKEMYGDQFGEFVGGYPGLKGLCHAICYLFKKQNLFCSNSNPKIMVHFCYFFRPIFRHCTIIVTVSCPPLQWMARMDMDWNLKKLGHCFRVVMLFLQKSRQKYYDWCYLVKFDLCFFLTLWEHF